jgi:hypothetical protein
MLFYSLSLALWADLSVQILASPIKNSLFSDTTHARDSAVTHVDMLPPLASSYCNWSYMNPFSRAAGASVSLDLIQTMQANPGSVETPTIECAVAASQLTEGSVFPSACLSICNNVSSS